MNGPHTEKSPIRAVKGAIDLTMEHNTSVRESGATVRSFGLWCSCSPSQSLHSSRGGGTRRVGLREGRFLPAYVQRGRQITDTGVNSTERFDFLVTIRVGTGVQAQAFSIRWPRCLGFSLDWGVLLTNMLLRSWTPFLWDTDHATATETCLSTRMRRYCGSKTRSRREANYAEEAWIEGLAERHISIFSFFFFFYPVAA